MEYKDITAGYRLDMPDGYRSRVFENDKLSPEARKILGEVWDSEYRMRYHLVNRLANILYDTPYLEFPFLHQEMRVFYRYKSWTVQGVRCVKADKYLGHPGEGRTLLLVLRKDGQTQEPRLMSWFGLTDIIRLYDMVIRTLYPRDDNPDYICTPQSSQAQ